MSKLIHSIWALGLLLTAGTGNAQIDRITGKTFATRSEVVARHGMVCTSVPLATQVGLDILKRGGSAVDAAIAANAALGLMEPVSNGIGGDLFAIVYSAKENKLYGLNGSGRSPLGLSYEQMKAELDEAEPQDNSAARNAADQCARLRGRLGGAAQEIRETLVEPTISPPAIRYAEEGFPVTELIAWYWARSVPLYRSLPGGFLQTYTLDGKGRAPAKGDIFKNPALAQTLRLIGEKGRDAFYKGEIADKIDAFMQANGGYLRKADFEKHTSTWVDPVSVNYRGYDVFELPPNGQGIAALQMLNVLEGFDLRAMGFNSAPALHAMIEAKKTRLGRSREILCRSGVLEDSAGRSCFRKHTRPSAGSSSIRNAPRKKSRRQSGAEDGDTIYLCTADDEGNMVSLIQSNYRGMGSGIVVPGLGFMFQDRGELFSMEPGHANVYAPGKRPFHTIIPGFVMKDQKAVARVRRDGRGDAAARPCSGAHQPDRLRHERAGSRRRFALATRRRQRTDRRKADRNRRLRECRERRAL